MRMENLTDRQIDFDLWSLAASVFGLEGVLPAASRDEDGIYEEKELVVRILPVADPDEDGAYTCGLIEVYECRKCTEGHLLWTFFHELVHAWFDSFRPSLYFNPRSEKVASTIATRMFVSLGGRIGDEKNCESYVCDLSLREPKSPATPLRTLLAGVVSDLEASCSATEISQDL